MNNADIEILADKIKDNWSLCDFLGKSEKEYMVAETIHAARINLRDRGEAFSIRGDGVFSTYGGGLIDNGGSYKALLEDGFFYEEKRLIDGSEKIVIFPTDKLIDKLKAFFNLLSK